MARHIVKGLAVSAFFMAQGARADFLPPNHLNLQDKLWGKTGITQEQFNEVIDKTIQFYAPIVEAHGGQFQVNRLWTDSTVNANATENGSDWEVNMYGGLARRPEITADGFQLVICHETGHHLGGFPFVSDWAADEGEADYFATLSCARNIWANETQANAEAAKNLPSTAKKMCDRAWKTTDDRNLCYRTMKAAMSISNLLGALGSTTVSFDTPDTSVVDQTDDDHPQAQCRLDTYVAGAVCTAKFDVNTIPGKNVDGDQNGPAAERDAGKYSCLQGVSTVGYRPNCWFKPQLSLR